MSIDSYDDTFPESDRPGDRTFGGELSDAAQEAGDKLREVWDDLTGGDRPDRGDPLVDPPIDPTIRFHERR